MTPYIFLFAIFLCSYVTLEVTAGHRRPTYSERYVLLLPLAVFGILYAGRIGTDVESYKMLFQIAEDFPLEPGFALLMIAAKLIGLDYIEFTKLLATMQFLLLALIVKRLRDPLFFLFFYMSSFYLNFHFNAIRNSFALLIIAFLFVRRPRFGMVSLIVSPMIHYSSLITLSLMKISTSHRKLLMIGSIFLTGGLAIWAYPDLFIYSGHLEQEHETKSVYPALLLKFLILWLVFRNGGSRFYLYSYALLVVLIHVFTPILSRLSDLVLFLAVLDFCTHHKLLRFRKISVAFTFILVVSSYMIPLNDCETGGYDNWCLSGSNAR